MPRAGHNPLSSMNHEVQEKLLKEIKLVFTTDESDMMKVKGN